MARPKCVRSIHGLPDATYFKPRGIPLVELDEVVLTGDEYEAIRLADLDGRYHEDAAARMNISRATFGRIIESARRKVADALTGGKAIKIEGGSIRMSNKRKFHCSHCEYSWEVAYGTGRPSECPQCRSGAISRVDGGRGPGGAGRGMACRRRRGRTQESAKEKS
jgi:predicted DNA-binding protein (UPF0251 family)